MLAPIIRIVATFAMMLIIGAVWSIVDAPDAYAAETARRFTDGMTFKVIGAYLILAFCWGIFWIVATGGGRRDQ